MNYDNVYFYIVSVAVFVSMGAETAGCRHSAVCANLRD